MRCAARGGGGQGELDGGEGGAHAALGPGDRDDPPARPGGGVGVGGAPAQVPADAHGPLGGGLDAGGELVVGQRQADEAAGAGVHGGGEERRSGVRGHQDDPHRREAEGDFPDELQCGHRADPLVDEDHLGEFVEGVDGEPGEGVEQCRRVGDGR